MDSNARYICEQLWNIGIAVLEIRTLPDNEQLIREAFLECAKKSDLVFSTGGLGPTRDDHSSAAAAKAFDLPLIMNEKALQLIDEHYSKRGKPRPDIAAKISLWIFSQSL